MKGFRGYATYFLFIILKRIAADENTINSPLKRIQLYLLFILFTSSASAQLHYEEIANKFIVFYNKQIPDSLFNLYTPELKEKLTLEKTKTVLEGLHVQYGDLRSLDLIKQDSGFNSYKASFLHQNLTLLLALNDENLIEGYRLVPYHADPATDPKNKNK